jgi:BirA family biotin operon repressor/biotin-[acetyl-CoA-carboxylase] ligase
MGYNMYMETFEQLSAENILSHLKTNQIGRCLIYLPSVSSTMDVARHQAVEGAAHGTTFVAGKQENGKGRLNRRWVSPDGGVYVSVILYLPQELIPALTMIASLAVSDCISEVSGVRSDIKWPNDILINGKKVSGILASSGNSASKGRYAVVGIGINANMDLYLEPELADIATSLLSVTGKQVSRLNVICGLLLSFERRYTAAEAGEPLWQEWRERLITLGQQVSIKAGEKIFNGLAESVKPDGSLMLRRTNGKLVEIPAGDVTLRT